MDDEKWRDPQRSIQIGKVGGSSDNYKIAR